MLEQDLIKVASNILLDAVENSKSVIVGIDLGSVKISSYQDKIGTMQQVSLYYNNCDGRHDYLIFSIKEKKDNSDSGYFSIHWDKVSELTVTRHYNGVDIKVDKLTIIIRK